MKQRVKTIPTILGILVLVVGVIVGVIATQYEAIFRLGAQSKATPQDVRISNINHSSATISWITDIPATAAIVWGNTPNLGRSTTEPNTQLRNTHAISLTELEANTTYYFKISSAGEEFDNNGQPWQFQTGPDIAQPSQPLVISGNVLTAQGQPAKSVLVYITAAGVAPMSAITSDSGNWIIPLGLARSANNTSSFAQITPDLLLQVFVQAGPEGVATAQIPAGAADPVPPMSIGQTHDFTDAQKVDNAALPEASIDVPENDQPDTSRFDFLLNDTSDPANPSTAVTLESIDEGEIITTQVPEFFGEGPAGTTFTITVESDPITANVNVPSNGVWQWSPPTNLPEGEHKVTIKWLDADGILRTLTRSFVVSAQEGPAFESTPSGNTPTPIATSTPSPTIVATATPKLSPTPTASPTASPRVSYPATDSGTPDAGSLTPTLALSMMGIGLFFAAFFVSIKYK